MDDSFSYRANFVLTLGIVNVAPLVIDTLHCPYHGRFDFRSDKKGPDKKGTKGTKPTYLWLKKKHREHQAIKITATVPQGTLTLWLVPRRLVIVRRFRR